MQPTLRLLALLLLCRTLVFSQENTAPAWRHAPLLAFGVGSLAMGALLYGIQHSGNSDGLQMNGRSRDWDLALGAAGVTALAAGWSYVHYVRRDRRLQMDGSAWVLPTLRGDASVVATLQLHADLL